ncbi:MAG TPA: CAP domain-containing protein [Gallionella sp.]|nr:CAP domain-containing protein [Gallionella sp.]
MKISFVTIAIFCASVLASIPAFAEEIDAAAFVVAHNKWRAEVGVKEKLNYSPTLAASAQAWADNLKRTNHCRMRHSKPRGQYGENLYWASATTWSDGRLELQNVTPGKVVDSWGGEKADYDYAANYCPPGKMCGHYTQMVWRTTTAVGCARAICEDTLEQVWVCQYQPAGNRVGNKPY